MRLRDSCALAEGHHPMIEAWSRHRLACLRIEEHALAGFRLSAVPFRFERKHGYRLAGHDLLCHFGKQMIDAAEIMQNLSKRAQTAARGSRHLRQRSS